MSGGSMKRCPGLKQTYSMKRIGTTWSNWAVATSGLKQAYSMKRIELRGRCAHVVLW